MLINATSANPKLYTVKGAAECWGVSAKCVRHWIASRRVSVIRPMGWAIRITEEEIQRVLEEGRVPAHG